MTPGKAVTALAALLGIFFAPLASPVFAENNRARRAALESITAEELTEHVRVLAHDSFEGREAGTRGGHAAARYLATHLEKLGATPAGERGSYYQPFGANMFNVLCQFPGSDPKLKEEYIVVGAHFDHVGYGARDNSNGPIGFIHNGADDNASGTAALLEIASALKELGDAAPRRTIVIGFWDGEEKDLLGARHWVANPTVPREKIKLAFNADMIGRLRNDRVEVYGARTAAGLRRWASEHNRDFGLSLIFDWDMKADSDHHCFYSAGIPVLMLHTGLHEQYHRPSDDVETIDAAGIERISRFLLSMMLDAADRDELPAFREESRRESNHHRRALEVVRPSPPRLGVQWDSLSQPGEFKVIRVDPGSAAERAGIAVGDEILAFNGVAPAVDNDLRKVVAASPSRAHVTLRRANGKQEEIVVELPGVGTRLGVTWRDDPGEPDSLLIVQVMRGSAAEEAGIYPGDRIYSVGDSGRVDAANLARQVADAEEELTLEVEREGRIFEAKVKLPPR